jgi:hypothetical protein
MTQLVKRTMTISALLLLMTKLLCSSLGMAQQDRSEGQQFWSIVQNNTESLEAFSVTVAAKFQSNLGPNGPPSDSVGSLYSAKVDKERVFVEKQNKSNDRAGDPRFFLNDKLAYVYTMESANVDLLESSHLYAPFGDPRLISLGQCGATAISLTKSFDFFKTHNVLRSKDVESYDGEDCIRYRWASSSEEGSVIVLVLDNMWRVRLFEWQFTEGESIGVTRAKSQYNDGFAFGKFPQKTVVESLFGETKDAINTRFTNDFEFSFFESGVHLPDNGWEAINLDVGTPVVDLRIKERLGYWSADGTLSDYPPGIVGVSKSVELTGSKPPTGQGLGFWIFVSIGVTTLALALLLWYRGRDQKS